MHDAAAIAALYAESAFWQQHPFREPEPDYLARVFAEEESAQCRFGTPIVTAISGCALERADQADGWQHRGQPGADPGFMTAFPVKQKFSFQETAPGRAPCRMRTFPRKRFVKFCTRRFRGNVADVPASTITIRTYAP